MARDFLPRLLAHTEGVTRTVDEPRLSPIARLRARTGDALWFQHMVLHAGKPVTRGVKHVLRTDVLFKP